MVRVDIRVRDNSYVISSSILVEDSMKTLNLTKKIILLFLVCVFANVWSQEEISDDLYDTELTTIRGLIKPTVTAVLSSEIAAQIDELKFRDGDVFKKGDLLVKFDCSYYYAQLAAAKAELESARKQLENKDQLLKLSAGSQIEVDLAAIDVKKTKANVSSNNVNVSRCKIKAPYDGRVIETMVNQYESVGKDQELLSILNEDELEIEVIVPSNWLQWLKPDIEFQFNVDETSKTYSAKVTKLGAVVDPVSQTIAIKGVFIDSANVLSGMSGTAKFQKPEL